MRKRQNHGLWTGRAIFLVAVLLILVSGSQVFGKTYENLYLVKKIFLETNEVKGLRESSRIEFQRQHVTVAAELERFGFAVVDDRANADAVMCLAQLDRMVVFDGPDHDPPTYQVLFRLSSERFDLDWKTEFEIRSKPTPPELSLKTIRKVTTQLFKDWKRSARRAGYVVKDGIV